MNGDKGLVEDLHEREAIIGLAMIYHSGRGMSIHPGNGRSGPNFWKFPSPSPRRILAEISGISRRDGYFGEALPRSLMQKTSAIFFLPGLMDLRKMA